MTDTLTQLPPGWGVVIRVAAVVAGRMVDTTNAVGVTMPAFAPPAMSRGVNAWSMPALSTGFATVWEAGCWSTAPSTVYIGWAKNAAAARYTVQLRALDASAGPVSATPSAPVITSSPGTPLPPKTVFGTSEQFTLPNGYYDVYVRPEFLVYNWPSYGPSADLYVSGAWVYTGIASVPSPVPNLPCSHP